MSSDIEAVLLLAAVNGLLGGTMTVFLVWSQGLVRRKMREQMEMLQHLVSRFDRLPCQLGICPLEKEMEKEPVSSVKVLRYFVLLEKIVATVEAAAAAKPGDEIARIKGVKIEGRKLTVVLVEE